MASTVKITICNCMHAISYYFISLVLFFILLIQIYYLKNNTQLCRCRYHIYFIGPLFSVQCPEQTTIAHLALVSSRENMQRHFPRLQCFFATFKSSSWMAAFKIHVTCIKHGIALTTHYLTTIKGRLSNILLALLSKVHQHNAMEVFT